jgi:anti-anti-sigma factor
VNEELIMLHVSVEDLGESVVLHCAGRIVRGYETALLCAAVRQHGRSIALDLSGVEAIDAAGIGALISLQATGIYLQILSPTKAVRELLRITRLDTVFEICSSMETDCSKEYIGEFTARPREGVRASIVI